MMFLAVRLVPFVLIGALYVGSPFLAAWNLREAVKHADTAYLEEHVSWGTVRESLKASLAANAKLLPVATAAGEAVKPSLWQRFKSAMGVNMLDRFIESYVTAEGLPKLYAYKNTVARGLKGEFTAESPQPILTKLTEFWGRVKRAEFQTLTRLEIELADKSSPERHIISTMELEGTTWKLTTLKVVDAGPVTKSSLDGLIGG